MDPKRTELEIHNTEQTKEWLEAFESKIFKKKLADIDDDLQVTYRFLSWCGLDSLMVINRAMRPQSPLDLAFVELKGIVKRLAKLADVTEVNLTATEEMMPHSEQSEEEDRATAVNVFPMEEGSGQNLPPAEVAKSDRTDEAPQQIATGQDGAPIQHVGLRVTPQAFADATQQQQRGTPTNDVITADVLGIRPRRWPD